MYKVDDSVVENVGKLLDRDPSTFQKDIGIIKTWMEEQPHFPEILDTRSVQNFLILNKFSIERTKEKIDRYYTFKSKLEDIFGEINPELPHMKEVREIIYLVTLPQLFNNQRVYIYKMRDIDLGDKLEPINLLRHLINIFEIRLKEDVTFGEIFLVNCANVPLSFYLKITPTIIYKAMIMIYEKLYSCRMKGLYLSNFPPIGEKILNVLKKIIKPKIFDRIHVVRDNNALLQHLPEDLMPPEFGGKGLSLDRLQEMLEQELTNHKDLFDHLDKIRVNESLRPGGLKNDEDLGFYGNFRNIDVD